MVTDGTFDTIINRFNINIVECKFVYNIINKSSFCSFNIKNILIYMNYHHMIDHKKYTKFLNIKVGL